MTPPLNSNTEELREQIFEIVKAFKFSEQYGVNTNLPTDEILDLITHHQAATNKLLDEAYKKGYEDGKH